MSGILYIVSTPIGNLEDITLRALRVLREVDLILAEDTRVTRKLLEHYKIKKELARYDEYSHAKIVNWILGQLEQGKNIALVSDAGTPGISDPGQRLVNYLVTKSSGHLAVKSLSHSVIESPSHLDAIVKVVPIPGSNAAITALSVSGFPTEKFCFLGFPSHKKGREKFFKNVAARKETTVFYESPHRILKTLDQLQEFVLPDREIMIARELTKMFETIYRGTISNVKKEISTKELRGEFVIILNAVS